MGYKCNNKCIFCCMDDRRKTVKDKTTKEILLDIKKAREGGSTYLELIGGEPTIRRDILKIVSYAKKQMFDTIMFATNGRMFSNKEFADKVIQAGVNSIVFSIHGSTGEIHDSLTQVPGSFDQLLKGIENVKKHKFCIIGTNTTITKKNYRDLPAIARLIDSLDINISEFIFVDPTHGLPKHNFDALVPTYEEIKPYVDRVLEFACKKNRKHWHVRYFPLCFIDEKYHNMVSELLEVQRFHTKHIAPDFFDSNAEENRKNLGRVKIEKCDGCKFNDICEGYWKEYISQMKK